MRPCASKRQATAAIGDYAVLLHVGSFDLVERMLDLVRRYDAHMYSMLSLAFHDRRMPSAFQLVWARRRLHDLQT